ncbi:MAG: elongation factor G [Desulfovibrio sp.]|jgi:elongation factor G|nr:elongation factor G [Desulfovibrio sp.]
MRNIQDIRNIGVIAHIDAGKTTLSERMLFYSSKIHRMGEVHDGAATMDYLPEEQNRGITITAACTSCEWQGKTINLVDTPGHVDFTIEVERSLRVLDGAVGIFCAVGGVEPQSETVWRQSENFCVPKIAFINKMDRQGANFEAVLSAMRDRLDANPLPVNIPLGQGGDFTGVLDLVSEEILTFDPSDQGKTVRRAAFGPEHALLAKPWRDMLLEKLAENDDVFLECYLENTFRLQDIQKALRRVTLSRGITPVLCGSALRNMGVQPVLDAIIALLPSPLDMPHPTGHTRDGAEIAVPPDIHAPAVALVFKILIENSRKLSFLRMYAGTVKEGDTLRNVTRHADDRAGRIFRLHADRHEPLAAISAGDIAAVIGLRSAHTGETYTKGQEIFLEPIAAHAPVLTLALEPRNADESKLLDEALSRFSAEDPTLTIRLDEESGSRMVSGMGELHLDILLERIRREYNISPRAMHPQVILRETISREAQFTAVFDKELGKERHHGAVCLCVKPRPRTAGNLVETGDFLPDDPVSAQKILPRALLQAALDGVRDGLQSGGLTGWPVEDVCVTLLNVERREGQTTAPGCHMAAGQALREALALAAPVALEPIMRVEITVPDEFLGSALNLLTTCNGKVEDVQDQNTRKLLRGVAPLRQLLGFSTSLRSSTQGRAGLSLTFDRFDLP